MGVDVSQKTPTLTASAKLIVTGVRLRSRLSPEGLQKFLIGSDPAKDTGDLLAAGAFLNGEDRKVVANVLKVSQEQHRLPELLEAAQNDGPIGEFASDILKCHESADPLNKAVLANLSGTDVSAIAVALKVLGLREDTCQALRRDVEGVSSDTALNDRAACVVRAVRAFKFLQRDGLATVLAGATADVHLFAMNRLASQEKETIARHLREHGNIEELMTLALRDKEAKTALEKHKNVSALVVEICKGLVSDDHDRVQLAADLLRSRRDDVLITHEVVPALFRAAARGVPGVFDMLVAHKAPVSILYGVANDAIQSSEVSKDAEELRAVAMQLVDSRVDLADAFSRYLKVTVQQLHVVPVQPLSDPDTQDATK